MVAPKPISFKVISRNLYSIKNENLISDTT